MQSKTTKKLNCDNYRSIEFFTLQWKEIIMAWFLYFQNVSKITSECSILIENNEVHLFLSNFIYFGGVFHCSDFASAFFFPF